MNHELNLKAFLDGELSPEEMAEMERALSENPRLREEAEHMKQITEQIQDAAKSIPVQGLEGALGKLKNQPKWRFQSWQIAMGVGCLLLLGTVVVPLMSARSYGEAAVATTTPAEAGSSLSDAAKVMTPENSEIADKSAEAPPAEFNERDDVRQTKSLKPADSMLSQGAATSRPPFQAERRQVIRSGSISVQVPDVAKSTNEVETMAKAMGGYVESTNFSESDNRPIASIQIRVDSKNFEAAIQQLRRMGKVIASSATGEDVTLEVADADARLKVLRMEEESLFQMLRGSRRMADIIALKDRINRIRQEIESLASQSKALKAMASLSSISVSLEQGLKVGETGSKDDEWLRDNWAAAWTRMDQAWKFVLVAVLNILAFAPLWLPFFALAWWMRRRAAKSN